MDRTTIKNMGLLLQGQLVTNMGGQIFDVALLLWLKDLTGSAAIMGLALLATGLPEALLAPMGGRIGDRYGRVRTMVGADLLSGLALAGVLAVVLLSPEPGLIVAALLAGNLILGISGACFAPAVSSLIPDLVPQKSLARANSAQQFCRVGGKLLGQGGGGFVYTALGPVGALILNAASFFASALSETFIRSPKTPNPEPAPGTGPGSLFRETMSSLRLVWQDRELRRLTTYIGFFHLALSCLPVSLPFYAEHILFLKPGWLGFLIAAYTVGIMVGFVLAGIIEPWAVQRGMARMGVISLAGTLVGLMFTALGAVSSVAPDLACLVLIGTGIGIVIVNLMTELQLRSPEDQRGGIMGAAHAVGGASLPLGLALTGIIIDSLRGLGVEYGLTVRTLIITAGVASLLLGLTRLKDFRSKR